ncbi:hypothetical protein AA958_19450 [Streptomyces sp. CNQ-509]|uniref:hypothetical protein n=1 Tax=Streptomyces sp. CNQ-509 TaxID=444103 RepID=UPI00062DF745|nr:hypothetical protein [Streptomyces sp. CNQ-509]AKH83992.1 hypothetical protein AA958_19450 [Streptomyces sp. CNQ-509]
MALLAGPYGPPVQPPAPLLALEGVPGAGAGEVAYQIAHQLTDPNKEKTAKYTVVNLVPDSVRSWPAMATANTRPLPHLARHAAGLLHASDTIRGHLDISAAVIANRWTNTLLACHAAASGATIQQAQTVLDPVRGYLAKPTRTFYLITSAETLRKRLAAKHDVTPFAQGLLHARGRLEHVQDHFKALAATDPTSVVLHADGRTPEELAEEIIRTAQIEAAEMALQT